MAAVNTLKLNSLLPIIIINMLFSACCAFFSFYFIREDFVPFDRVITCDTTKTTISTTLPEKASYLIKVEIPESSQNELSSISANNHPLNLIETKIRKSRRISKYLAPEKYVHIGNNDLQLAWQKGRLTPQEFNLTIKNFLSKPVEGMYGLPKQSLNDTSHGTRKTTSVLFGLLFAIILIPSSMIIARITPIEIKALLALECAAALPVLLFYTALFAATTTFPYKIRLSPSFYFIPFVALYVKSAYPLIRWMKNTEPYKKSLLAFFFLLIGCMLCLMIGLQSCARIFADISYIFLGGGIILGMKRHCISTINAPGCAKGPRHVLRDITILLFASLLPLLWFKKGHFIAGGDIAAFIGLDNYLKFLPYAWDEQVMAGRHNFAPHFILPYGAFWCFFKMLSVPGNVIELIWACVTLFISSLSMYHLIGILVPGSRGKWGRLIGSLLYIINPFLANIPLFTQYNLAPIYMFTPLVFAFFAQGLHANDVKNRFLFASLIALCSPLFASASLNITHLFVMGFLLFLYFVFFIGTNRACVGGAFLFAGICAVLYLLTNLWWISISFTKMVSMSGTVAQSHGGWEVLKATHLYDAFRLLGSWAWRTGHRELLYFPYFEAYDRWYFVLAEFGLLILLFTALWQKSLAGLFAGFLALTGLFFVKGSTGPLGFIYTWMWKHVPGFWIFREPFAKFMPLVTVAYAILMAISCDQLLDTLCERIRAAAARLGKTAASLISWIPDAVPVLLIATLVLLSFPLITGQCIWDYYNGEMRSLHVKVPDYWHRAADWFKKNDPDARILPLPKTGYGKSCFNWESGFNAECSPVKNLFPNPLIYYEDFPHNPFQKFLNGAFDAVKDVPVSSQVWRQLGIGYIVHQRDVDWRFTWPDALSHQELQNILQRDPGLTLAQSFGKLDIYKVADPLSMIYAVPQITFVEDPEHSILTMSPDALDGDAPFIFAHDQAAPVPAALFQTPPAASRQKSPILRIDKINPAKYIVRIETDQPFWLILNNTFSPEWKAYIDTAGNGGNTFLQKRVFLAELLNKKNWSPVNDHYVVNGFANGWRIEAKGSYTLIITYAPQSTFEMSIYISGSTILILLLTALAILCKRTSIKNNRIQAT